jgi:cytochrome bd-type quinol oxidase subunit 2
MTQRRNLCSNSATNHGIVRLILGYTSFSYWTFARKVSAQENYQ